MDNSQLWKPIHLGVTLMQQQLHSLSQDAGQLKRFFQSIVYAASE